MFQVHRCDEVQVRGAKLIDISPVEHRARGVCLTLNREKILELSN